MRSRLALTRKSVYLASSGEWVQVGWDGAGWSCEVAAADGMAEDGEWVSGVQMDMVTSVRVVNGYGGVCHVFGKCQVYFWRIWDLNGLRDRRLSLWGVERRGKRGRRRRRLQI